MVLFIETNKINLIKNAVSYYTNCKPGLMKSPKIALPICDKRDPDNLSIENQFANFFKFPESEFYSGRFINKHV